MKKILLQNIYKILFWTGYAAILIMACLPARGHMSETKVASVIRLDYLLHFVVYLAICLYFIIGRKYGLELFKRNAVAKFIIVIVVLASGTELVQLAVPSRSFNIFDLVANVLGLLIGLIVIKIGDAHD